MMDAEVPVSHSWEVPGLTSMSVSDVAAATQWWGRAAKAIGIDSDTLLARGVAFPPPESCDSPEVRGMPVANGSPDQCDPNTYGEISPAGMQTIFNVAGQFSNHAKAKTFLDIGSGFGLFTTVACRFGGFKRCVGIEADSSRVELGQKLLNAAGADGVELVQGDASTNPEVFRDVDVAYWNNLCFRPEDSKRIAALFATQAAPGATLLTLSPLPSVGGLSAPRHVADVEENWDGGLHRLWAYDALAPSRPGRIPRAAAATQSEQDAGAHVFEATPLTISSFL